MTLDGKITRTDDDAFTGWIASLTFDVEITLTPNPHKQKDTHPDYEITAQTPRGRVIRIGSAWTQISGAGNQYLSLAIDAAGDRLRVNALEKPDQRGEYRLVPFAGA